MLYRKGNFIFGWAYLNSHRIYEFINFLLNLHLYKYTCFTVSYSTLIVFCYKIRKMLRNYLLFKVISKKSNISLEKKNETCIL